jgi:hypothetical protein
MEGVTDNLHLRALNRHVLLRATPPVFWRSIPHIVVEAAVCVYDEDRMATTCTWQRCALTHDLCFEPPLVSWTLAHNHTGRTLCLRLVNGDYLLPPDLVRLHKLCCSQIENIYADSRVEVIHQIKEPFACFDNRSYRERAAFGRLVHAVDALANKSARTIQRAWRNAIANPMFYACRRRLLTEFGETGEELL